MTDSKIRFAVGAKYNFKVKFAIVISFSFIALHHHYGIWLRKKAIVSKDFLAVEAKLEVITSLKASNQLFVKTKVR